MSERTWRDWSCTVRVVVGQDEPTPDHTPDHVTDGAAEIVRGLMGEVERGVSRFRTDSEIEAVNAAAPQLLPVSTLTLALVEAALEAARRTDGAVDPTVGAHVLACGYDDDIDAVRDRGAADATDGPLPRPADWRRVLVDDRLGRVGVARGLRLDLGATAKAWTADEAAQRVASRYGRPALVEIGGDLAVAGTVETPWRVGVAEVAGGPQEIVGLTHGGLATSSTVARRWRTGDAEAHHVIDPFTGRPTDDTVRSATVWAPTCVEANTFSTAALVWGGSAAARLGLAGVAEVAGGPQEVVGLTHGGLATSSTVARRWRTGDAEAHHVIDPYTGRPTDDIVRSATVWAPTCVEANTFSTAALVWGGSAAARLGLAGVAARLVDRSGSVRPVGPWPGEERAA